MTERGRGDLGEAIYRAMAGRSPFTEVRTFGQGVSYLLGMAGGNIAGAARLAGVPRKTFADWANKGVVPRDIGRQAGILSLARAAERRARLPRGREKRLRKLRPQNCNIAAEYRYDDSDRVVQIGPYVDANVYNALCDAFLAGADLDGLRQVFAAHVDDPAGFYQTFGNDPDDDNGWVVQPDGFKF
jgi:hypothetical protein